MIIVTRTVLLVIFVAICSCSGSQNRSEKRSKKKEIPLETYIQRNKQLVADEQKKIAEYIDKNGLEIEQTQTGLWYSILKPGTGAKVVKGQVVSLKYNIKLLDGSVCYSSEDSGPKVFLVGQGGVESGLEEGILMLQKGSSAIFIMPPHLAHGLVGDDDRIPSRAILVYEIEVLDVKNKSN
jgi:FKBP-type peptidyl-prolyl cis-trans isomerase